MILQNEIETVKNLQNILNMSNTVILYDVNLHNIVWLGFVKDLPLEYLHYKIVKVYSYNINVPNELGTTVYIK